MGLLVALQLLLELGLVFEQHRLAQALVQVHAGAVVVAVAGVGERVVELLLLGRERAAQLVLLGCGHERTVLLVGRVVELVVGRSETRTLLVRLVVLHRRLLDGLHLRKVLQWNLNVLLVQDFLERLPLVIRHLVL